MQKVLAACLMLLGSCPVALAQTAITLYANPTGWAAQSNSSPPDPKAYNPAYDASSNAANYLIQELGNSDKFGTLSHVTQGQTQKWTETTTTNPWATAVIFYDSNNSTYYETTFEDGSSLACATSGTEYDYFLGPNNSFAIANVIKTAIAYSSSTFPTLEELSKLTVTGQVIVNSVSQTVTPANCDVNHISVGYSFNLYDSVANPPEQIAYTLHLGHYCLSGMDQSSCLAAPQNSAVWYTVQGVPAVTDTPSGFSVSSLSFTPAGGSPGTGPLIGTGTGTATGAGTITFNATDLLTRLKSIISTNTHGLDTNVSDWRITGLGYGASLWGDSADNISWSGLNVTAACVNSGCTP